MRVVLSIGLFILLASCSTVAPQTTPRLGDAETVTIMAFNVENLFDTEHDVGKNDYTFLPRVKKDNDAHRARCNEISVRKWREQCLYWDWSEQALTFKLKTLADVITQEGRGPDIIALQEVENVHVLERLRRGYLSDQGYGEPILIEGNDDRGIDVAFLSRLPMVGTPTLHPITFTQISERRQKDTRGILQANFKLPDGAVLTGYSVHFPAPYHPYSLRIDAYRSLNALLAQLPADRLAFAAGDFNTPSLEENEQRIIERIAKPKWLIGHESGCRACPGTSYYPPKDDWSFLDMILVRKSTNEIGEWRLNDATRLVNRHPEQQRDGYPLSFSVAPLSGVSDHWPLLVELERSPAQDTAR
ncbi:MAG: endonuclease/exonuclease/phosphatase family protein [Pseudomonadota bacterium]